MYQPKKEFYSRNLPHWQPINSVLFITTRLYGSLPKQRVIELRDQHAFEERRLKSKGFSKEALQKKLLECYNLYFGKFDDLLDGSSTGPHWFNEESIAVIWTNALFHFDQDRYKIICSTIMSNHVHFIFYKLDRSLERIMNTMKGFAAYEANKALGRTGKKFWQEESFDRWIRCRGELKARINYILNNPVKAKLVRHWGDWQWNYVHPNFLEFVDG